MKTVSVVAVMIRRGDEILMVKEKPNRTSKEAYWVLPAGGVEENETHIEAVFREAKEETGLDLIGEGRFIYHCDYKNERKAFKCSVKMYEFSSFEGIPCPNDPDNSIEEAKFFHVDEVINNLESLGWPVVKEPATAYLQDKSQLNQHWVYEADNKGVYSLVERKLYIQ